VYIKFEVAQTSRATHQRVFRVGSHLIPFSPHQEILRSSRVEAGEERVGQGDDAYDSEGVEDGV